MSNAKSAENAELNKLLKNLNSNSSSSSNSGNTPKPANATNAAAAAPKPANATNAAAAAPKPANAASKPANAATAAPKPANEPSMLNSITGAFTNIKNKVIGTNTSNKTNTNTNLNNLIKQEKAKENAEKAEKAERNAAEKAERNAAEKAERNATEKAERNAAEKAEKNAAEKAERNAKKNNGSSVSTREPEGESIWGMLAKVLIMIIVLVLLYYIAKYLINNYQSSKTDTPYLLNGSKNAKHALVVSQDPNNVNYIPINKSLDRDGIQFTYGFWFLIDSFDYKKGEWKHIFHKGNSSSYPNRAPGIWIHPDKNSIRVYMNTQENILEYADIDNIPVRKWIYMNIILTNRNLDLYINGFMKIRKELSSLPKQNDDDFWVSMFGGFEGYISNIRYYTYAIDFNEISKMIKNGPSINNCIDTGEIPPYLDDSWWFD